MKGPIGLLLAGGGIILLIGLFTGKINFPGASANTPGSPLNNNIPNIQTPGTPSVKPGPNNSCPPGTVYVASTGLCVHAGIAH